MPRVAITVPGKNSQPYRFQLDRKKVTIGRSSESDIIIDCPSISSLHCTMERVDGGYILRDRHSTNGITLDGEEMAVIDLRNDSAVLVGDVKFDYTLSDEELDDLDDEDFTPRAKKASDVSDEPEVDKKPPKKKNPQQMSSRLLPAPPPPFHLRFWPQRIKGARVFSPLPSLFVASLPFTPDLITATRGNKAMLAAKVIFPCLWISRMGVPCCPKPRQANRTGGLNQITKIVFSWLQITVGLS